MTCNVGACPFRLARWDVLSVIRTRLLGNTVGNYADFYSHLYERLLGGSCLFIIM